MMLLLPEILNRHEQKFLTEHNTFLSVQAAVFHNQ